MSAYVVTEGAADYGLHELQRSLRGCVCRSGQHQCRANLCLLENCCMLYLGMLIIALLKLLAAFRQMACTIFFNHLFR